jgi:hypothetical protein
MVTKEAMITMYAGILTFSGMKFFSMETIMFEPRRTKITPAPIPMLFTTLVETPKAGHNPRSTTNTGFSLKNPLVISLIIGTLQVFSRIRNLLKGPGQFL